ncbi:hypothetical protein B2J90_28240 (plasmid) [Bacillus tropicus]|uniref:hypothetical protein n=1 Tax=Bacillus tropicus TaxID=2026188 RepID=UPI000A201B6C|nr:hypothetical protein B2J90_28240 [Bacillus cereus]
MSKILSGDSKQLLQEVDRKMSIIESILQNSSGYVVAEEVSKIHQLLLEASRLLLLLEQDHRMASHAKELNLQLQTFKEHYNQIMSRG